MTSLSTKGFPGSNFRNFGFAPQLQILIYIFFNIAQCICKKNQSIFLCQVLSFRDNLTSLSRNDFPGSNFRNFGFAPQIQTLIYIFFNIAQCICNKNQSLFLCQVLSFRDNLTSLSRNDFPGSNFRNFAFAPQLQTLIYIFFNVAQCICNLFLCYVISFRDNLTSFSRNGIPGSNFPNFDFAPQTQILIYIVFNTAQCICNQKPKSFFMPRS